MEEIQVILKQVEEELKEHYRELKQIERDCLNLNVDCDFKDSTDTELQNSLRTVVERADELEAENARLDALITETSQQFNVVQAFMMENQEMFDPPDLSDEEEMSVEMLNNPSVSDEQETEDIL